jgi:hypothetical protein
VELFKKTQVGKELRITQREGALNIQQLVVRSPPHSSSLSKCAERKAYNEKIQFAQIIIQDVDIICTNNNSRHIYNLCIQ